jgi:DNA-binding transcriptional ArsR family regulator
VTELEARNPRQRRRLHDPRAPRLDPAIAPPVKLPAPCSEAIAAVEAYYPQRHRSIPELLNRRRGRRSKQHGRQVRIVQVQHKRSDITEAECVLMKLFFSRCDLSDRLKVGRWDKAKREVEPYNLRELATLTGLEPRTLDRAISNLTAAGFLHSHQPRQLGDDGTTWEGEVALRKLTRLAFCAFGVSPTRLAVHREKAEEREHRFRKRAEREAPVAPVGTLISAMIDRAVQDLRPHTMPQPLDADRLAYNTFCLEIDRAHREWTHDQVAWEALRRLYGPSGRPPPQR